MPDALAGVLSILFVAFFFGFSIFIHELGHMLAALWRGMHVDKFSIGFGHRILSKRWKGIDFIIGWLPLGGYVALPQMDAANEPQTEDGKVLPEAKPIDRIITALAGPLFNILFALVLGTIIYFVGKPVSPAAEGLLVQEVPKESVEFTKGLKAGDIIREVNDKPASSQQVTLMEYIMRDDVTLTVDRGDQTGLVIGPFTPKGNKDYEGLRLMSFDSESLYSAALGGIAPGSAAALAGLQEGDVIKAIDDEAINYFYQIGDIINADERKEFKFLVERQGVEKTFTITPQVKNNPKAGMVFREFPTVMSIVPEYPAALAGIEVGDEILSVNGYPVSDLADFKGVLSRHQKDSMKVAIRRGDKELDLDFVPNYAYKQLGVQPKFDILKINPVVQITRVVENTYDTVKALISPNSGVDMSMMSSFVGISSGMYKTVRQSGIVEGLSFVLMINVALAIFNLLPFPVLDGGHIVIALIEMISRKKVPAAILQPIYVVFMLLLMTFALYATFNDVRREVDTRELVHQKNHMLVEQVKIII
ncbi:site-2 protease family protein [Lentisphaera profundi]|uniref:Site-2 protease family protein n=1 Tax=Lentisphaera profundi TaxID=1658616 RepID=A0ABY7VQ52_9BACT|nr:site-2 protease family protein [Lentisphaera profundi]WDE95842.1 site-2 protease family protein [Lentisphaera profundi]